MDTQPTDKQIDEQAVRQTDGQMGRLRDGQAEVHIDRRTYGWTDKQTYGQIQTDGEMDSWTKKVGRMDVDEQMDI